MAFHKLNFYLWITIAMPNLAQDLALLYFGKGFDILLEKIFFGGCAIIWFWQFIWHANGVALTSKGWANSNFYLLWYLWCLLEDFTVYTMYIIKHYDNLLNITRVRTNSYGDNCASLQWMLRYFVIKKLYFFCYDLLWWIL